MNVTATEKPILEKYGEDTLTMIENVLLEGQETGDVIRVNTRLASFVLYNAFEAFYITKRPDKIVATADEYMGFMQQLFREGIAVGKQGNGGQAKPDCRQTRAKES